MTYEEAKAFNHEWCAGRRRLMVEGEGDALEVLSAVMDHCLAVEEKWCVTLGLTRQELEAQCHELLQGNDGDPELIAWLEGKRETLSPVYPEPE
jgi:hypothetical protein